VEVEGSGVAGRYLEHFGCLRSSRKDHECVVFPSGCNYSIYLTDFIEQFGEYYLTDILPFPFLFAAPYASVQKSHTLPQPLKALAFISSVVGPVPLVPLCEYIWISLQCLEEALP